jgi:DNA-binding transcriptional MerR regulator
MRSGAAARLAGISASTLRIWEYRYGVVAPPKSAAGQRTYPMKDIERLRLIKRLTVEGHAISTLAHLDVDALVALSSERQAPSVGIRKVLVVGNAAARKLEGRLQPRSGLVFEDLNHAERDVAHAGPVDVLVIHVRTLHASLAERIVRLRNNLPALNAIVVYSFGAEAVPESLRAAGMTVRREPLTGKELAGLIVTAAPVVDKVVSGIRSEKRRYSDADLIALAEIPSPVACECPRHLVEIVTLLVGFEQYNKECASQNQNDAALHRHLLEVTAHARAMLEQALARVVIEEGLSHWISR